MFSCGSRNLLASNLCIVREVYWRKIYAAQNAGKSAKKKLIVVFSMICGVLINLTILPQPLNIQGTGVLLKLQSVSCLRFTLHWKILM